MRMGVAKLFETDIDICLLQNWHIDCVCVERSTASVCASKWEVLTRRSHPLM